MQITAQNSITTSIERAHKIFQVLLSVKKRNSGSIAIVDTFTNNNAKSFMYNLKIQQQYAGSVAGYLH
ncbi:hypothetical protein [Niabella aquatica]